MKKNTHQMKKIWQSRSIMGLRFSTTKLLHIVEITIHQTTHEDHPTNSLKIDQQYYVNMFLSPTMIKEQQKKFVNLDEVISKLV